MLSPPDNILDAQILAEAIVNTIPEPFLVLDGQLRVLAASRSFYAAFKVDPEQTHGCLLYDLGDGQWDIPALRLLLETIIPQNGPRWTGSRSNMISPALAASRCCSMPAR